MSAPQPGGQYSGAVDTPRGHFRHLRASGRRHLLAHSSGSVRTCSGGSRWLPEPPGREWRTWVLDGKPPREAEGSRPRLSRQSRDGLNSREGPKCRESKTGLSDACGRRLASARSLATLAVTRRDGPRHQPIHRLTKRIRPFPARFGYQSSCPCAMGKTAGAVPQQVASAARRDVRRRPPRRGVHDRPPAVDRGRALRHRRHLSAVHRRLLQPEAPPAEGLPITIGGRSTPTVRVAAEHVDRWNMPGGPRPLGWCNSLS